MDAILRHRVLWAALCLFLFSTAFVAANRPNLGADGAQALRAIIGNQGVADLEAAVFNTQDTLRRLQYDSGLAQAEAPWAVNTAIPTASPTPLPTPTLTPTALPPVIMIRDNNADKTALLPTMTPTPLPSTATPTATPWQPATALPLGNIDNEGVWTPYITTADGVTVGYRTFLQPDPERPFTLVGVVAIDLDQTDLHFVLGTEEPSVEGGPTGHGRIPAADKTADILLAAFNGGFKATHGHYGAMADGLIALPAKEGLATVGLYKDGSVRIGAWGSDITTDESLVAWRQNAHLVVENGTITDVAARNSLYDWSGSIDNEVVTWRSGLGISADGRTLYYFAGSSLNMPALGAAMTAVGVEQGLLLDINPYWVHFTAFIPQNDTFTVDPLFPAEMHQHADRFLRAYQRDFFYITAPAQR